MGDLEVEKGGKIQEERVSHANEGKEEKSPPKAGSPKDSLVATTTEDILFQQGDSANVYPLVSVTCFLISPSAFRYCEIGEFYAYGKKYHQQDPF